MNPRRKNEPHYARDGRMIGRIELGADTEADPDSGLYRRRVFFLLPASTTPKALAGKAPPAKPPPRTVQPNRVGEKTSRSQQGSPSVLAATSSWDREPAPSHGCVPRPAGRAGRRAAGRRRGRGRHPASTAAGAPSPRCPPLRGSASMSPATPGIGSSADGLPPAACVLAVVEVFARDVGERADS
ncbi:DUF6009 family protein [Streptomyces anulatus]|uniref:DUF6009 family protein n=1 Tax=Streptomyces anulatus TaxID=1892 RepID=UPI0036D993B4